MDLDHTVQWHLLQTLERVKPKVVSVNVKVVYVEQQPASGMLERLSQKVSVFYLVVAAIEVGCDVLDQERPRNGGLYFGNFLNDHAQHTGRPANGHKVAYI